MSEAPAAPQQYPDAVRTRRRWPGLVWAVPLAALIIVGYLGLHAFAERGVDVIVTFSSADGIRPGDTKVIYQGLEAGRVTRMVINKDGRRVDLTLRLVPRAKPALVAGTQFWLVGAQPSLTDIASLKAALAGLTIGMSPGTGAPTRHFIGLQRPPPVPPGTKGVFLVLSADQVGSIRPGASLYYHGLEVGKVISLDLVTPQRFDMQVFVQAPYDRFVHADTLFWSASPVSISFNGAGVSTKFAPAAAAITGGVEFDTSEAAAAEPQVAAHSRFTLYVDHDHALAEGRGPKVGYTLAFRSAVGDVDVGAPVKLGGFQIGSVTHVGMTFDMRSGAISSPIAIAIDPSRLHMVGVAPPANDDWRPLTDAALDRLFAHGYRGVLQQSPPLIGARYVALQAVAHAGPARILHTGTTPALPTHDAGDIDALTDKASAILDKLNAVPLDAIGHNVREITGRIGRLLDSPQVADSLTHLDGTLKQVDGLLQDVKPKVGPLLGKLNLVADQLQQTAASANGVLAGDGSGQDASLPGAIRELTDAARSIRSLSDYLGRHPEAILKGKAKEPAR